MKELKKVFKVNDYHCFLYEGHRDLCDCDDPHIPHVIDVYSPGNPESDDAWEYERYCLGKEGFIPGVGYLRIVELYHRPGSPSEAEISRGYWYIERK